MARFLVLLKSLIGGQVREPGEFVELDPTASFAAANLHPLDADAIAMRAQAEACTAESAPLGSATANEMKRMLQAGKPLSEDDIQKNAYLPAPEHLMEDEAALKAAYPSMFKVEPTLATPPANVAELREQQRDLTTAYPTMREQRLQAAGYFDDIEQSPEQARQQRAELGQLFDDIGASHQDAGYAVSKAREFRKNPPTALELADMRDEAKRQLSSIYGKDAPQALADAQKLATRDPRWKALLETTHLGTDPGFVVRMAAMARAERARGRLG